MSALFYIYEHWRPDRDECFYVGKGRGARANIMRGRNAHHRAIQAKLARLGTAVEVRIIAEGLDEGAAFTLEKERIAFWRADGADLANLTEGGEGVSGTSHTAEWKTAHIERNKARVFSEETRKLMRSKKIGKPQTAEHIAKGAASRLGKKKSPATIEAIRAKNIGKTRPPETIEKMRAAWTPERKAAQAQRMAAFNAARVKENV